MFKKYSNLLHFVIKFTDVEQGKIPINLNKPLRR